jgi:DNA-binding CsgD family transcriptional regulator
MTIVTPEQKDAMCEMRERGLSIETIARELELKAATVNWHCTKLAADPPAAKPLPEKIVGPVTMKRGNHTVQRFTPEDDARILAWRAEGIRNCDIARKLARRPHSVAGRLITLARREAHNEARS